MRVLVLLCTVAVALCGWQDLFKFPWTGVPLPLMTGISCPVAGKCYVAGSTGSNAFAVYKSTDDFKTVTACTMNTTGLLLLSLVMGSETHGIAGGVGALKLPGIIYTANGETWRSSDDILLITGQDVEAMGPEDYAFVGSTNALLPHGGDGAATSKTGGLLWGNHPWKGITLPQPAGTNCDARYGAFPSATTWYVTGGSWPPNNNTNSEDVHHITSRVFIHKTTGRAGFTPSPKAGPRSADPNNGYSAAMTKTTDGGKTWEVQYSGLGDFYFNGVHCADETHCMAVGEGFTDGAAPGGYIFGTTDGKTWTQLAKFTDPDHSLMKVYMLSATEAWAAGAYQSSSVAFAGAFYHTTDGGKTWEKETVPGIASILGMRFTNNNLAYATGITELKITTIVKFTS